jgi:chloramphenicol-sensitive protein RarD
LSGASAARRGIALGLGAYLCWGFLPLFFKLLAGVDPAEIVAQRVVWSLVLLIALIAAAGRLRRFAAAWADPRARLLLAASAALIGTNWLVYVWAINAAHVLETSLGYFLNPLVNVVMGVVLLKERLSRAQGVAVLLAAAGVAVLAIGAASGLWISLALAGTFATYGLIRKIAPVESLEGLAVETILLAPVALGYLGWLAMAGGLAFGTGAGVSALLVLGGAVTAVPLLLFAAAARLLPYSLLGLLQYLAPSIQFLLATIAFGEPLTPAHLICFACIWTGLAIFAADGARRARAVGAR